MSQGEIVFIDEIKLSKIKNVNKNLIRNPRIVLQGITGINERQRLKMMVVENAYCANSLNYLSFGEPVELNYFLGLMNSKLMNFVFSKFSTNSNVNGYEVDNLPVRIPSSLVKRSITTLAGRIIAKKTDNPQADTGKEEMEIDILVYHLYNLTYEEAKLIDERLNEEEYANTSL